MTTTIRCRAKNPATCKFHAVGQPIDAAHEALYERLEDAQNAFDFDAYGEAFTELQILDGVVERAGEGPLTPIEAQGREVATIIDEALDLMGREKAPSRQERAALYARVPNEVVGETVLGFLKKYKKNNLAVIESKNPYMYRVLVSNIRQYQPDASTCEQIVASGDHRARLLLASRLKHDGAAIQGGDFNVIRALSQDTDPEIREYLARLPRITPYGASSQFTQLFRDDPNADVRLAYAQNENLGLEDAEVLANDTDPRVVAEVEPRLRLLRPEAQRKQAETAAAEAEFQARFEAGQLTEAEINDLNWDDEHNYFKYYAN